MTDPTAALSEMLTAAEALTPEAVSEDATPDELAMRLDLIMRTQALLKDARDAIELMLVETMDTDSIVANGVKVYKEQALRATWKPSGASRMRADLAHAVANKFATDIETGEVNVGRRNLIQAAIDELWTGVPSFTTIKKDARERWDLKVSEYRQFTEVDVIKVAPVEDES